jgi:hypothetical protein
VLRAPRLRLHSAQQSNRTGAEVNFAWETRRSNLRRIPQAKGERVRRMWIPTTSLTDHPISLVCATVLLPRAVTRNHKRGISNSSRAPNSREVRNGLRHANCLDQQTNASRRDSRKCSTSKCRRTTDANFNPRPSSRPSQLGSVQ